MSSRRVWMKTKSCVSVHNRVLMGMLTLWRIQITDFIFNCNLHNWLLSRQQSGNVTTGTVLLQTYSPRGQHKNTSPNPGLESSGQSFCHKRRKWIVESDSILDVPSPLCDSTAAALCQCPSGRKGRDAKRKAESLTPMLEIILAKHSSFSPSFCVSGAKPFIHRTSWSPVTRNRKGRVAIKCPCIRPVREKSCSVCHSASEWWTFEMIPLFLATRVISMFVNALSCCRE